jgi:hypothetical protein
MTVAASVSVEFESIPVYSLYEEHLTILLNGCTQWKMMYGLGSAQEVVIKLKLAKPVQSKWASSVKTDNV